MSSLCVFTFIRFCVFMRLQIEDDGEKKKYSMIIEKFLKFLERAKIIRTNICLIPCTIVGWHSSYDILP